MSQMPPKVWNEKGQYIVPDDGVWWLEHNGHLTADKLDPSGPAAKAGIRNGDAILSINGRKVETSASLSLLVFPSHNANRVDKSNERSTKAARSQ